MQPASRRATPRRSREADALVAALARGASRCSRPTAAPSTSCVADGLRAARRHRRRRRVVHRRPAGRAPDRPAGQLRLLPRRRDRLRERGQGGGSWACRRPCSTGTAPSRAEVAEAMADGVRRADRRRRTASRRPASPDRTAAPPTSRSGSSTSACAGPAGPPRARERFPGDRDDASAPGRRPAALHLLARGARP